MKRIRVLYIIDTLEMGGAEKSLVEITSGFSKVEPFFIQIYEGDALKYNLIDQGIKVYSLNISDNYGYQSALKQIQKLTEEIKPDIIHASLFRSIYVSRKLKQKVKIPLVNSFTSNSYVNTRYKNLSFVRRIKLKYIEWLDKRSAKYADFFISNSEVIKQNNSRVLGISPDKIHVIPRGRDSSLFKANKINVNLLKNRMGLEGKRILLNVGRLIESKGQDDLIKAFAEISKKNADVVLLIAGEGKFRQHLEERIQRLGLSEKVILLGNRKDIPELLAISDLFVFPTYLEGLPGSLIEAMMSGTPIICSDIPENKECVPEGGAAFFTAGNIPELADLINNNLDNPDSFNAASQKAYDFAVQNFELEKICRAYEAMYYYLLSFNK